MLYESFKKNIEKNALIKENEKIVLLHSLGKDATVLLDLLCLYRLEKNFELIPILFRVPRHVYLDQDEVKLIIQYWQSRGIKINVVDFPDSETRWEERNPTADFLPCEECRRLRNKEIEAAIRKHQPHIVAAGFNLTDLQNYLVTMMLISNYTFDANKIIHHSTAKRFLSLIPRFFIKVASSNNKSLQWILPLLIFEDKSIITYLDENKIPYLKNKCNFKNERARNVFGEYVNKLHCNYNFETDYNGLMDFLQKNLNGDINRFKTDDWLKEK